jgi:hypothetical protein
MSSTAIGVKPEQGLCRRHGRVGIGTQIYEDRDVGTMPEGFTLTVL